MLQRLRRAQRLDAQHALGVLDDAQRLPYAPGAHRNMVLLVAARRDGIDRRRVAERLVLGDERGGEVLRHHEPRVQAAGGDEERRQAVVLVEEEVRAALGDRRPFGDCNSGRIGRERQRLPVEGARRHDLGLAAGAVEHERVVGHAVDLDSPARQRPRRGRRGWRRGWAARTGWSTGPAPSRSARATARSRSLPAARARSRPSRARRGAGARPARARRTGAPSLWRPPASWPRARRPSSPAWRRGGRPRRGARP